MAETRGFVVVKSPWKDSLEQSGWEIADRSWCLIVQSRKLSDRSRGYKLLTRIYAILSRCSWFAGNISRAQSEQLLRQKVSHLVFKVASKDPSRWAQRVMPLLLTETRSLLIQASGQRGSCPAPGLLVLHM